MDPYPFSLDDAVNEGARKTRPAFDQKSWATYFIKALQDLLRLSVRDRFPVLLTVVMIRFHGLKGDISQRRKVDNQEDHILHTKQQLRLSHGINAPCGGPRLASPGK